MKTPYMTETGIFFHLFCGDAERGFLISTAALRLLGRRLGFVMDYMNLYLAHEALIHALARDMAERQADPVIYLEAEHFPVTAVGA
ncbi:hypothetical protein [Herbaspirillum chlorophenolicum]|uniref:hypothetical protein n=1 Tax=Herbaspirillum chlorophenolicum TaxID=211589 RepID=UPI000A57BF28|nr:hypothetical protein [Herbaspirillum chlorophenolicum]